MGMGEGGTYVVNVDFFFYRYFAFVEMVAACCEESVVGCD